MTAANGELVTPPGEPAKARVVFMRDDDVSTSASVAVAELHVVDERGDVLGHLAPRTWFAAELPAGPHVIAAWHDAYGAAPYVSALRAELEQGRTYFVRVVARTRLHLDLERGHLPLEPHPERTNRRLDPVAATEWSAWFRGRVEAAVQAAQAKLEAGEGASLRPRDGFLLDPVARR